MIIFSVGGSGRGWISSPLPIPNAVPPLRKNGTSEPRSAAMEMRSESDMSRFQKHRRANKVIAALELPPPSPAPKGMFFLRVMDTV